MFKAAAASYAGVLAQYLEGQRLLQASHCLPTPLVVFGRMATHVGSGPRTFLATDAKPPCDTASEVLRR